MIAHKFGGTSVSDASRIAHVARLLTARDEQQVVVVSAMKGVTDALIALVERAAARDTGWRQTMVALRERHRAAADDLLGDRAGPMRDWLAAEFQDLGDALHAQALVGAVMPDLLAFVSGLGEVWSSRLLAAALQAHSAPAEWLDARDVVVVEPGDLGAIVCWAASRAQFAARLPVLPARLVVPGFVARTSDGRITTLGRNGSDLSGAIFAALTGASELHIWSDVDGVLSADPRLVPEAVRIERMSYAEACELAYFGARVLHPQTMAPVIERDIPIVARNTFRPDSPGTRIDAIGDRSQPVKGVTTFADLAIVNLEGAGMIGVPGTAQRAFAALERARVSVVMISQGSSEHSICCVVKAAVAGAATAALRDAFARELEAGQISAVSASAGLAALAIVGDGMRGMPGVAARLFGALARANVNVRVIAQGASERNISVAIDAADAPRALRAVHAGFYLSAQTIAVGLVGPGNVGTAFLTQLAAQRAQLRAARGIDFRVRAVAAGTHMALGEPEIAQPFTRALLEHPTDLDAFLQHVRTDHLPHAVIIDCSASDAVADRYPEWLARGVHVIAANKNAGAGPIARYRRLFGSRGTFRYESTVGAGLPVITTLRDLIDTGDEVLAIDGILSGTLAFLLHHYDGSKSFGELVREARRLGYTEPDPRDDLSGRDVARKLVILARECGLGVEVDKVALESLVPPALAGVPLAEFLDRLDELDGVLRLRLEHARRAGCVLRYVARVSGTDVAVRLTELPSDHAFANLKPTDNVVQFTTRRYRDNPLVVQGPGAGPEVTAMGVFADLLRVAASLGAGP